MLSKIKLKPCLVSLLGSAILAFGLYNIHSFSDVTEGGVLGLTLLFHNWFGISPAVSGLIMNTICYLIGFKILGKDFIIYSVFAGGGFSLFYAIFEQFDPVWLQLSEMPLLAAILGAIFVGVGVGLCVRMNSAPSGDDALAMGLSKAFNTGIQWIYLIGDITVLALSVTYIPLPKLAYSLLTVILSGQIVGLFQNKKKSAV